MTNLPVDVDSTIFSAPSIWEDLLELAPELQHAYQAKQIFRTETEARISVLDNVHFPTKASKYWQALREQVVMLEQLAFLSFEHRKLEVKVKRIKRDLTTLTDEFDLEEAQILLEETIFRQQSIMSQAADRAREIKMWSKIKAEQVDGSFDTDNVDAHQLISYTAEFALQAAHMNPASTSQAELNNIIGKFQTAVQRCQELGVLDQVIKQLPSPVVKQLQLTAAPAVKVELK